MGVRQGYLLLEALVGITVLLLSASILTRWYAQIMHQQHEAASLLHAVTYAQTAWELQHEGERHVDSFCIKTTRLPSHDNHAAHQLCVTVSWKSPRNGHQSITVDGGSDDSHTRHDTP